MFFYFNSLIILYQRGNVEENVPVPGEENAGDGEPPEKKAKGDESEEAEVRIYLLNEKW